MSSFWKSAAAVRGGVRAWRWESRDLEQEKTILTVIRVEGVRYPSRFLRLQDSLSVLHVVELEFTRNRHADFFRVEITRIRHIHFSIRHLEFHA
jgi:hypothetical protein